MEKELNHDCIICGVKYHHCDDCAKMKSFTPWRAICDTEKHYQIFLIIKQYQDGLATKEEVKEQLENINISISDIDGFKDSVKNILTDILADETSIVTDTKLNKKFKTSNTEVE